MFSISFPLSSPFGIPVGVDYPVLYYPKCCAVLSHSKSCPTLCDPMDCSPPGSSVHGDSPGKNTGVCCHALFQGSLNPGIKPRSSALQMDSLLSEPPGKVGAVVGSQLAAPWWRWLAAPGGWGQWSGLCHGTLVGGLLMLPGTWGQQLVSALRTLCSGRGKPTSSCRFLIFHFFLFIWLSVCYFDWVIACYFDWVISIILSSRSLILSSVFVILLFILMSSVFISANKLSNFSWLFLIVSSSFLQLSAFLLIAFLNSFSISLLPLLDWRSLFHCSFRGILLIF